MFGLPLPLPLPGLSTGPSLASSRSGDIVGPFFGNTTGQNGGFDGFDYARQLLDGVNTRTTSPAGQVFESTTQPWILLLVIGVAAVWLLR